MYILYLYFSKCCIIISSPTSRTSNKKLFAFIHISFNKKKKNIINLPVFKWIFSKVKTARKKVYSVFLNCICTISFPFHIMISVTPCV